MNEKYQRITLRVPAVLQERLRHYAQRKGRKITDAIVDLLQQGVKIESQNKNENDSLSHKLSE